MAKVAQNKGGAAMGAVTIQQMADRVAALMEERLRIKGAGLSEKLAKGGGRLPRKVRAAAKNLAEWAFMSQNARLLVQVDEGKVAEAYDICVRHLGGLKRRGSGPAQAVLSVVISLAVVAGLLAAVLKWRGYV